MKPWRFFCLVGTILTIVFLPRGATSSQPESGWKRNVEVEGIPLTVTWHDEGHRPVVMAWMQESLIPQPHYVPEDEQRTQISRKGINRIPEKLMIIPGNRQMKPAVLEVDPATEEIAFSPEAIPANEIWFWGFTPSDPCPSPSGQAPMSVTVRLIHRKEIYDTFYGSFVWRLVLDSRDKYEIPFYFSAADDETIASITIEGFNKANDISQSFCFIHRGGECEFTAETSPDVWGRSHQIVFQINKEFDRNSCPLF